MPPAAFADPLKKAGLSRQSAVDGRGCRRDNETPFEDGLNFMPSALQLRKPCKLSDSLNRQLSTYAKVASAAGVSVLALAGVSEGKVIYTETHQVMRPHVPLYIDLNHDGIRDFVLRTTYYVGTSYIKVGLNASGYHNVKNVVAGRRAKLSSSSYFFSAASALRVGAGIGPKRKFPVQHPLMAEERFKRRGGGSESDAGPWAGKGEGVKNRYLGLKFMVNGKVHYGWARLSVTLGHHRQYDDVSGTLTGYAYETIPNKPILAGTTKGPEVIVAPSSTLGELAIGRK
jgi:hypothetical protein